MKAKKVVLYLTSEEVIAMMKNRQGGKPQSEFAEEMDVSPQLLSEIYRGNRSPGTKILKNLGVEKCVVYRLIEVKT